MYISIINKLEVYMLTDELVWYTENIKNLYEKKD